MQKQSQWTQGHSGCLDSKKNLSTIDAPPGVPGVSKNQIFFLQMKMFSFCAKIAPRRHKLQKTIKIEEKMSNNPWGGRGGDDTLNLLIHHPSPKFFISSYGPETPAVM